MGTRAKYSGAVGTVIDGRLRDLQDHRNSDFPVCLLVSLAGLAYESFRSLPEMYPLHHSMKLPVRARFVISELYPCTC